MSPPAPRAMDGARVDALVFPVWTYPPKINGDRGQTPQGQLAFIASATQWPVVVVPMGFVGENLPIGFQFFGRPWSEGQLIRFAYAYEQFTHHRRPPPDRDRQPTEREPPPRARAALDAYGNMVIDLP